MHSPFFSIASAYGSECGSAGVKFIPTGGLFVTGGLTPKNIQWIEGQNSPFMKAYSDKGRVKPVLDIIPVFAVMTEDLGVRGAHKCAQLVRLYLVYMKFHSPVIVHKTHSYVQLCTGV